MQDDLLVVGFDLETRREVHVAERPPEQWKRLGYGGTGQLVCFYCFHGFEAALGGKVALEAQRRLMTDSGWRARHRDYARQGIVDVWFWRPRVHFPHIVLDEGLPVWFHSLSQQMAATALGRPHARTDQWWRAPDLSVFGLHHPPCPLDELERVTLPLGALGLGAGGATLPEDLHKRLRESQRQARKEAEQRQAGEARHAIALRESRERAARAPAPPPLPPAPPGGLRCEVCHRPLDPLLAKNRRHILC